MLRALVVLAVLLLFAPSETVAQTPSLGTLYVNSGYDPRANPYRDLERAIDRATAENKRVLIVVGGDWCVWCEVLDRFLARNDSVRAAFVESFVMVKVNWSRENENRAFLSAFPESVGYPDFFVLDSNGAFLAQQGTAALEDDRSYHRARMVAFAQEWRR